MSIREIARRVSAAAGPHPSWIAPVERSFLSSVGRPVESPIYESEDGLYKLYLEYKRVTLGAPQLKVMFDTAKKYDLTLDITGSGRTVTICIAGTTE